MKWPFQLAKALKFTDRYLKALLLFRRFICWLGTHNNMHYAFEIVYLQNIFLMCVRIYE